MLFYVTWWWGGGGDSWSWSLQDVFFPGCENILFIIVIVLLHSLYALCVYVAVMGVQNVVELLMFFTVAVCALPHPPQQPMNATKHEPGTVK
jgi:hypothetical protein